MSPRLRATEIKSDVDLGFARFTAEEATDRPAGGGRRTLRRRFFEDARGPLRIETKIYFLRGNHEDHELLKDRESSGHAIYRADPGGTFNYLSDGGVIRLVAPDGAELKIGILGGIHAETRPGRALDNPLMTLDHAAIDRLLQRSANGIDVLLTHQGPAATHGGHAEIDTLIEVLRPRAHAHGHAHTARASLRIGDSISHGVPALDRPRDHALAIEWDVVTGRVRLVDL